MIKNKLSSLARFTIVIALFFNSVAFAKPLADKKTLDPNSPADNIEAWVKLEADTNGSEVYRFGSLTAYGIPEGQISQQLFKMISLTKTAYRKRENGDYESRLWGCGLYADAQTGEIVDEITNPYTKEKIKVKPYCSNISGSILSVKKGLISKANFTLKSTIFNRPYLLDWLIVGDSATVNRNASTEWQEKSSGKTKYETSIDTFTAKLSDLNNPELTSVDASNQYTLSTEWMTMLNMGDLAGHMLWIGSRTKHTDLSEIPANFIDAFKVRLGSEALEKPLWEDSE